VAFVATFTVAAAAAAVVVVATLDDDEEGDEEDEAVAGFEELLQAPAARHALKTSADIIPRFMPSPTAAGRRGIARRHPSSKIVSAPPAPP
jgi:hypothetical protein